MGKRVKRKPRKGTRPDAKEHIKIALEAKAEKLKNDPEFAARIRAHMAHMRSLRPSPSGWPRGWSQKDAVAARRRAKRKVDKFIEILKDEGILPDLIIPNDDNEKAEKALRETCQIAFGPGNVKDKLTALKTVLEYTKAKPESKSKVTLNKSEDFLAAIAKDMEDGK